MAYEAIVNQIAVKVADAIHDYANAQAWPKDEYHIFMKINMDYLGLSILVVARVIDGQTEDQRTEVYHDLRDAINAKAKTELKVINYFGLVLTGFDDFNVYWSPRVKPAEIEVDEKLINQGVSWNDPSYHVAH